MKKEQLLVNASIEVRRAVFAMNERPKDVIYISGCIEKAINDLKGSLFCYRRTLKKDSGQAGMTAKVKG